MGPPPNNYLFGQTRFTSIPSDNKMWGDIEASIGTFLTPGNIPLPIPPNPLAIPVSNPVPIPMYLCSLAIMMLEGAKADEFERWGDPRCEGPGREQT